MNILSAVRQLLVGGLLVAIVIGTILGSVVLSINEGAIAALPIVSPAPTETIAPPPTLTPTPPGTPDSSLETSITPTPTPTPSETPTATPTVCPIPVGWQRYTVSVFDTIEGIAARFGITVAMLMQGNCLPTAIVSFGQTIYVPSTAPTPTPPPCEPPRGWAVYIVRPGDTLTGIASRYGLSVWSLMRANCLTSANIYVGQLLRVPFSAPIPTPTFWWWPTITPIPPTWTPLPVDTPTPIVPTWTPGPIVTDTPPAATDTPAPPTVTTEPPTVTVAPPTSTPAAPTATLPVSPLTTPVQ